MAWMFGLNFFLSSVVYQLVASEHIRDYPYPPGVGICTRIDRFEEKIVVPYNYTYQEPYKAFCFRIPPSCTRYRTKSRQENKTVSVFKTKTVVECCDGFLNDGISGLDCVPFCQQNCTFGECTKPDVCDCEPGWKGRNCSEECDDGYYGKDCLFICDCQNGGTCNKQNGTCHCLPGFAGMFCEASCSTDRNSTACESRCNCTNGGSCSPDGLFCECPPGYLGKRCEHTCGPGSYGNHCSEMCECKEGTTKLCKHTDGTCVCRPGWEGEICDSKCNGSTWGLQCGNECECQSNGTCHHVTGKCLCPPGWFGLECEEKCPDGFFEQDCKMKCPDCRHDPGSCHHVTGWCNCPPGLTGKFCDLICPEQRYGENCSGECLCENNSTCDAVTGNCECTPGWIGIDCSLPCYEGFYGINCSFVCNCSDNATCNARDGSCNCSMNSTDPLCPHVESLGEWPDSLTVQGPSFVWMVLVVLAVVISTIFISCFVLYAREKIKSKKQVLDDSESTANVIQDEKPTKKQGFYQFDNPNYESPDDDENFHRKSMFRVTPVPIPEKAVNTDFQFDDDFGIPECDKDIKKVEIAFPIMADTAYCSEEVPNSIPKIRYSCSGDISRSTKQFSDDNPIYADVDFHDDITTSEKTK